MKKYLFWRISVSVAFTVLVHYQKWKQQDSLTTNLSTNLPQWNAALLRLVRRTLKGKIISLTSSAETEVLFFLPYSAKKFCFFRWNLMWKMSWRLQVSCSRRRSFLNLFIILKIYVQINGKKVVLECWSRAEAHSYSIKGNQLKHRKRQMNRITCICDICCSLFNKPVISFWKH